jgi:hypothetical protein
MGYLILNQVNLDLFINDAPSFRRQARGRGKLTLKPVPLFDVQEQLLG